MNQQKRAVQFADQHDGRSNGQDEMVRQINLQRVRMFSVDYV